MTGNAVSSTPLAAVLAAFVKPFCPCLVIILAATACDALSRRPPHRGVPVVVDDTLLRYPDSSTLALGAGALAFIGQFDAERAAPFVVVAAHGCESCGASDAVLVRAPSHGRVAIGDTRGEHPYPGRSLDAASGSVRSHARVFWGECMYQRPRGVVSFRTEYGAVGDAPVREHRITEIRGDSLIDWRREADVRSLAATLQQVRTTRCVELPPRDLVVSP